MKLLSKTQFGNITASLYQYKYGYGYKLFTKLKGKRTCVGQSYCYYFDKDKCIERMENNALEIMNKIDEINGV